ncbi:hypothetical protein B0H13DRAFT_2660321 [Mycena leptocephala]|nr:hypothetical protein B0H13DRAFT_2660321 [Mycena leptocephala]
MAPTQIHSAVPPKEPAHSALDALLDHIEDSYTAVRAEMDRLARELHEASEERDSLRKQCHEMKADVYAARMLFVMETTAKTAIEARLHEFEEREAQMRKDEEEIRREREEIRRDREELAANFKRMGQEMRDKAEHYGRTHHERIVERTPAAVVDRTINRVLPGLLPLKRARGNETDAERDTRTSPLGHRGLETPDLPQT